MGQIAQKLNSFINRCVLELMLDLRGSSDVAHGEFPPPLK